MIDHFTAGTGYGLATLSIFTRSEKSYELSNHLGNIPTTITDKKIAVPSTTNSSLIDHFTADIATAQDYYPFGMLMPGRTFTAGTSTNYRYGFNGKENDNEVTGTGDEIDYGKRYYDPRVGKFLSVDPLSSSYAWYSPYQYAGDKPIFAIAVDGLEEASASLTLQERAGLAVMGIIMATTGHPKEGAKVFEKSVDINVSTTVGYRGPLTDIGQKVVTSAGSTLNGGLHTATAGAWPLNPSATLGVTPALNADASNLGELGGAFVPSPFHGMPGANLELTPSGSPSALQLLNQTLHLPLTVYSNTPGTNENPTGELRCDAFAGQFSLLDNRTVFL